MVKNDSDNSFFECFISNFKFIQGPIIGLEFNGTSCSMRCQGLIQALNIDLGMSMFFRGFIKFV